MAVDTTNNSSNDGGAKNDGLLGGKDVVAMQAASLGPIGLRIKEVEREITEMDKRIHAICGVRDDFTGAAAPARWDIQGDTIRLNTEEPLMVARVSKIIEPTPEEIDQANMLLPALDRRPDFMSLDDATVFAPKTRYVVRIENYGRFVVNLNKKVAPTDIEEGTRVGLQQANLEVVLPLPPRVDPAVSLMELEERPDVTYESVGGCNEQLERLREVVEAPLLHPERFEALGIDPPKGVLLYGPPGTGKTLSARAVANRTDACFIRVIGSELVQRYIGEGARMVREIFTLARTKKACVLFFDEVDAFCGTRFDDGQGSDNEVQRTMLELITQLDGFDMRGNIKVLMATNRPDTLDPAIRRPGRLDRQIEFGVPDAEGRAHIFRIHCKKMTVAKNIRYELLARACTSATGAEVRSVCTEAGMFAIRDRRKLVTERDLLKAINKVIKGYRKFSSTPKYMHYN